ncbi:hypothetical protein BG015_004196 [Linnemannia schmuckeri]|uniref:F-box domain-containing protein n=1 Tax=Linnemannia schmuckeri TaxID=64567 RepID=A0A9P5S2B1_9FUNG|nr:hypothetical protein BG015_004196 [Linnemannia schmuckeri]
MSLVHPLELPEIIEHLGHFLSLWTQEQEQQTGPKKTVFTPKTFLTCLRVSRLWHQTLLPILWATYDAEGMEHVPTDILRRYSSNFRTFCMPRGWILFTFVDCTKLTRLTLNSNTADIGHSRQMVRSNPGLKSLKWNGPSILPLLPCDEFASLTRLESLTLSLWDVSGGRLGRALRLLAGSIKELEIGWLTGLHVQGTRWITAEGNDTEDDSLIFPCLELVRLPGLCFGPDPAEFVKSCPNLARLELTLERYKDNYKDDEDIVRITDSLCAHCPKLRSLAVKGTIEQGLKATLIRNCATSNSLSEIIVVVPSIDSHIADSIALHASTLSTLGILNMTNGPVALDQLFQLPARCPRLRQFSVGAWYCCETGPAVLDAIRTAAWRSNSRLEVLDLDIGDIKETSKRADASTLGEMFKDGPIIGWHYHAGDSIASYKTNVRLSRAFVEDMFKSVAGFENLWLLRWCMIVFTRSSRPAEARFASLPFIHSADD